MKKVLHKKPPLGPPDHLAHRGGGGAFGGAGGSWRTFGGHASGLRPGLAAVLPGAGVECAHRRRRAAGADAASGQKPPGSARHGDTLRAGAGVSLPRLAQAAARLGFAGFEFLAGIPGTVGAGVRLNVGASGQPRRGLEACLGGHAPAPTPGIDAPGTWPGLPFLSAAQLPPLAGGGGGISPLAPRRARGHPGPDGGLNHPTQNPAARQPQKLRQRLKNPAGGPAAGRLIEAAGFKGHRLGDAVVSRKHANFILNAGHATAGQVKALMADIQEKVGGPRGWPSTPRVVWLPEDLA